MKANPADLNGIALVKVWSEGQIYAIGGVAYFENYLAFDEKLTCILRDSNERLLAKITKVDAVTFEYLEEGQCCSCTD